MNFQSFFIIPPAPALFAFHIHIGQKLHFNPHEAFALTRFASAAFDIEAESSGRISADARFGQFRVQITDGRKGAGVSGRIRARRAADGRLVNINHFVQILQSQNSFMFSRPVFGLIKMLGKGLG